MVGSKYSQWELVRSQGPQRGSPGSHRVLRWMASQYGGLLGCRAWLCRSAYRATATAGRQRVGNAARVGLLLGLHHGARTVVARPVHGGGKGGSSRGQEAARARGAVGRGRCRDGVRVSITSGRPERIRDKPRVRGLRGSCELRTAVAQPSAMRSDNAASTTTTTTATATARFGGLAGRGLVDVPCHVTALP